MARRADLDWEALVTIVDENVRCLIDMSDQLQEVVTRLRDRQVQLEEKEREQA